MPRRASWQRAVAYTCVYVPFVKPDVKEMRILFNRSPVLRKRRLYVQYVFIDTLIPGHEYTDPFSERKRLRDLVEFCKERKIDKVLVDKPTRVARSLYEFLEILQYLWDNGFEVIIADETIDEALSTIHGMGPYQWKIAQIILSLVKMLDKKIYTEVEETIQIYQKKYPKILRKNQKKSKPQG